MDFFQSKDSYRFSSDALLLAEFISKKLGKNIYEKKRHIKPPFLMLDLGCGCGIIGLSVLQYVKDNFPDFFAQTIMLGVDNNPKEIENAKQNAIKLQLDSNYEALCLDIVLEEQLAKENIQAWAYSKYLEQIQTDKLELALLRNPRLFKVIMANPPWYQKGSGLESKDIFRRNSLFGDQKTLPSFISFGEKLLEKNAYLYLVGKSEFLTHYIKILPKSLPCTILQNVHNSAEQNAIFFLLETRYQSKADPVFAPPIFLENATKN